MRSFAYCCLVVLVSSGCQSQDAPPTITAPEPVWLTIDADAVEVVTELFASRDPSFEVSVTKQGIAALRLDEAHLVELSAIMHHEFRRCGGYVVHDSAESAKALLDRDIRSAVSRKALSYVIDNPDTVQRLIDDIDAEHLLETMSVLSGFTNRFHASASGLEAARWLADVWDTYAQGRADIEVELVQHPNTPQPSVMMTITGSTLPEEVIVIGAHLDSIAGFSPGPNTSAPGADDDASGVATVTEVLRVALANGYRPDRTIKAIAYAAEEVGLRGSDHIASQMAAAGVDVVGVLQLDMTNYSGSATDIFLISDFTNAPQNQFLANLIDTYLGLSHSTTACGYACSDHASWTAAGFPASFPFEAGFNSHNPFIHTGNDTITNSGGDASHAAKFARLTGAYLAEAAKGTVELDPRNDPPIEPPGL